MQFVDILESEEEEFAISLSKGAHKSRIIFQQSRWLMERLRVGIIDRNPSTSSIAQNSPI